MNEIKSFTIYKEYYELITLLNEKEQQELSLAILKYMFEGIDPKLNEKEMKIFNNLKRPLNKSKNKSKNTSKQNQNEIKMKSNKNQKENTSNDVNVNVDVNVNNLSIYEYIETNFGRTLNPIEYEEISKWEDNELTRYAIKTAVLNNAYSIKYIIAILNNWKAKNLKTVAEVQKAEAKHKGEELPEWFDKKVTGDKLNTEEEFELREIVKAYE